MLTSSGQFDINTKPGEQFILVVTKGSLTKTSNRPKAFSQAALPTYTLFFQDRKFMSKKSFYVCVVSPKYKYDYGREQCLFVIFFSLRSFQ